MNATRITSVPDHLHASILARLMSHLSAPNASGCMLWTRALDGSGYAKTSFRADGKSRSMGAHRLLWLVSVGPIPDDLVIDHLCRNRSCCNVEHLQLVTTRENVLRGAIAQRSLRTRRFGRNPGPECIHGHSFSGDNLSLYKNKQGYTIRVCRTCLLRRQREHQARRKETGG